MQDLILLKEEIPRLNLVFNTGASPNFQASDTRLLNQWKNLENNGTAGDQNTMWYFQDEIDVSGWGVKGETFYPTGFNVQFAPYFEAMAGDSYVWETVFVTQSPFDMRNYLRNVNAVGGAFPDTMPGMARRFAFKSQGATTPVTTPPLEYEDFIGGMIRVLATSEQLPLTMQIPLTETDFSALTPTATDKLYVTRLVGFQADVSLSGGTIKIPACRVIQAGMTSKESKMAYIMRLKDSFKLNQSDVGLI